jgi:hypothetical protein
MLNYLHRMSQDIMSFHAMASVLTQTNTILVVSFITDGVGFIDMWALIPPEKFSMDEPFLILMLLADRESVLLECPFNTLSQKDNNDTNIDINDTSEELKRFIDSSLLSLPIEEAFDPMKCPSGYVCACNGIVSPLKILQSIRFSGINNQLIHRY